MATRQHILPRFLLKGFSSKIVGKNIQACVYRKGGKVFETNITNIAVERNFYGKEGGVSVDDEITKQEGDFALLLEKLRTCKIHEEVHDSRIADFITHLAIRNKHLREGFRESSEFVITDLSKKLSDFDNIKLLLLNDPKTMKAILNKIFTTTSVPRAQRRLALRKPFPIISKLLDQNEVKYLQIIRPMWKLIVTSIPEWTKDGHIQALLKEPLPEPRTGAYRQLHWYIYEVEKPLVLGDVGCYFETSGNRRYLSITGRKDRISKALLPISSKRILVGAPSHRRPRVDPDVINTESAKLSREFFVYSQKTQGAEKLALLIGENADIISKDELKSIVQKKFLEKL